MAAIPGLTVDDFEKLPDALALNHELDDGELVKVSGNTLGHNLLRDLVIELLRQFIIPRKLGVIVSEQEFQFGDNAYAPDIAFIGSPKVHLLNEALRVQRLVPDLAIEIASENDRFNWLAKKAKRYRDSGASEVWIFSIALREAWVYSGQRQVMLDENEQFSSDLIPGFSIRIGDLFDRIQ